MVKIIAGTEILTVSIPPSAAGCSTSELPIQLTDAGQLVQNRQPAQTSSQVTNGC